MEVGFIETSRRIDSDVIYASVVIFVAREVMSVLVPIERSPIGVFAGDGFGMRGVYSIANERASHLLGEGKRKLNLRAC